MSIIGPEHIFRATHGPREYHVVKRIRELPDVSEGIVLSPESKYDKKGDLTGLMFLTEGANAVAYPGLVPDNGCGFCLGLIRGLPAGFEDWSALAGALIRAAGVYSLSRRESAPADLLDVMLRGLPGEPERFFFNLAEQGMDSSFLAGLRKDASLPILLEQPFGCFLGHFLEIRKPESEFEQNEYILIIHSGSQGVHRLLNNVLHEKYAYHSRVYGAGLQTAEGRARKLAAGMAMNYAKASRLKALDIIGECLRRYFGAEVVFLSDVFHSYLQYESECVLHCRGIQNFNCPYNDIEAPYYLLAGTQTTSSLLMKPDAGGGSLCHGTPESLYGDPGCGEAPPPSTLRWKDTDSEGNPALFEAITRELGAHFESQGIASRVTRLLPVLNMQRADR